MAPAGPAPALSAEAKAAQQPAAAPTVASAPTMPVHNVLYSSKEEKAAAKSARRAARREAALAVKGQVSALAEPANWAAGLNLRYAPPPPLCAPCLPPSPVLPLITPATHVSM